MNVWEENKVGSLSSSFFRENDKRVGNEMHPIVTTYDRHIVDSPMWLRKRETRVGIDGVVDDDTTKSLTLASLRLATMNAIDTGEDLGTSLAFLETRDPATVAQEA